MPVVMVRGVSSMRVRRVCYREVEVPMTPPNLSPDDLEYWTERAAIAEYEGGLTQEAAERSATEQLRVRQAARMMRKASER